MYLRPHRGRDARVSCQLRAQSDDETLAAECVGISPGGGPEEVSSGQVKQQMKEYSLEIAGTF